MESNIENNKGFTLIELLVVNEFSKVSMYLNGKLISTSSNGILSCNSCSVRIGSFTGYSYLQNTWGSLNGFTGYMDEIKIYNYTLTTAQVQKLYAESVGDKSLAKNQINQE